MLVLFFTVCAQRASSLFCVFETIRHLKTKPGYQKVIFKASCANATGYEARCSTFATTWWTELALLGFLVQKVPILARFAPQVGVAEAELVLAERTLLSIPILSWGQCTSRRGDHHNRCRICGLGHVKNVEEGDNK